MKAMKESFLQNIDEYFQDKSQKDTYLIYFMIFSIIFSSSYFLLWDIAEKNFKLVKENIININSQLDADNRYLQLNPENTITLLTKDIQATKAQMMIHKENNNYIKTKIETISSLIYDEVAWGNYLYSISKKAKNNDIKITKLTNKYNLNKNSFGHILDITINTTATYKDTLKFINSLEQSNLVVDIHDFNITTQNQELHTDLNISVWGIAY